MTQRVTVFETKTVHSEPYVEKLTTMTPQEGYGEPAGIVVVGVGTPSFRPEKPSRHDWYLRPPTVLELGIPSMICELPLSKPGSPTTHSSPSTRPKEQRHYQPLSCCSEAVPNHATSRSGGGCRPRNLPQHDISSCAASGGSNAKLRCLLPSWDMLAFISVEKTVVIMS
jgi:hypothetical protein